MIVVHHLEDSRSQRVLWLLEELAVPYQVRRYRRDPKTKLAPPELLAVHPLGKSPVIDDDGLVVAETGAIAEYLLDRYGEGRFRPPPGTEEHRRYTYWLHFAEGSAVPPVVMAMIFQRLPKAVPFFIRPIAGAIGAGVQRHYLRPTIDRQLTFIDLTLSSQRWFTGDEFGVADVMMSFPIEAAKAGGTLAGRVHVTRWLEAIHGRPAYLAALATGGPYAYA